MWYDNWGLLLFACSWLKLYNQGDVQTKIGV